MKAFHEKYPNAPRTWQETGDRLRRCWGVYALAAIVLFVIGVRLAGL